ncbi:TadE/TadG family type IV pilus assembly protein [Muricoccus vinaceus]|uniref:TadE/TadG family type IV pilus assembly protein n=1 Tax=Muricoccus vinaceus TaxID=424704 RepID=A0ABV6IU12_9PROT
MRRSVWAELRCRRGATALEFALVGGLALTLLLGSMEAARFEFTQQALRSLSGEAVRVASLKGSANMNASRAPCAGLSGSLTGLDFGAPFLSASTLTVTMSGCRTEGAVTLVTVTVSQPFGFKFSLLPLGTVILSESAQGVFN